MKKILLCCLLMLVHSAAVAGYERNKAEPVEKVLFGTVQSVRNITEQELIEDKHRGWKMFGGALIGAAIGNQFGGGRGRDAATILGALIGASVLHHNNPKYQPQTLYLIELMISVGENEQYRVIQDKDPAMLFSPSDEVRMVYLKNGTVRVDKQM